MTASASHPSGRRGRVIPGVVTAIACLGIVAFYFWTVSPAVSQLNTPKPADAYYNLLVQGFRSGHLSLNKQPSPELARLANPYDSAANVRHEAHDLSYYRGRFYLYFGATPALLLFWPYAVLTGHYLFHKHAVAIFCAAGFLAAAVLLRALRRRCFPDVSAGVTWAAVVALGLATGVPIMLRRPDVWEVPIGCAYALVMVALVLIWRALQAPRRAAGWVAAASLVYGLAVGARPSLLFGAAILLVPAAYWWGRAAAGAEGRPAVRLGALLAAAVGPIALIGLGLLLYNYERFGNPLEFGQKYQLTWFNEHDVAHFSSRFFWYNLHLYFLQPTWWSCYFPFVEGPMPPPAPPGQVGVEFPFGVLVDVPLVWLALAAPLAWRGCAAEQRPALRWFLGAVVWLGAASALPLCFFAGVCNRYEVDFLPALVLLAVCGYFGLERRLAARPAGRWLARGLGGGLLAFSVAFNVFASLQYGDWLRMQDASTFRRLARWCDRPVAWVERLAGARYGPWEVKVMLPPFTRSRLEPLLVTGFAPRADYLYLEYVDPGHILLGFEHTDWGGPTSAVLPVDYAREHTFVIEVGSLYPPAEHPFFADAASAMAVARLSRLRVSLDGREVLAGITPAYEASPWSRYLGSNPFAGQFGRRFTGRILARRTLAPPDLPELNAEGPVTLRLRFGRMAAGLAEPLVVTGVPGRADFCYVRYPDPHHIILGLDHWGGGGPESAPIAVEPGAAYEAEVRMGSLYSAAAGLAAHDPRRRELEVWFAGQRVLTGDIDFFPATAGQVYFGWNPLGGSTTGVRFTGDLVVSRRGEPSPAPPGR